MFKASVNEKSLEVVPDQGDFIVNGERVSIDLSRVGDKHFHVLYKHKSFRCEVVKADHTTKTFSIKVNGKIYPVQLKNKFDLLLEKMGMTDNASAKLITIKAPMPGLIIDLKVKEGDSVKQHDPLLILEAMKMENIIKAPGDGVVKHVKIKKGNSVEKNQVLIEF